MTVTEYVEKRIHDLILEVAEMVNSGEIEMMETEAESLSFLLFKAECALIAAWRRIVG